MSSVDLGRSSELGTGAGGGIRMALWLLAIVVMVSTLALFAKTSVVNSESASLGAMQLASVEAIPVRSPFNSWTDTVGANEDDWKEPGLTTSSVAVATKGDAFVRPGNPSGAIRTASIPATPSRITSSRDPAYGLASYYGVGSQTASGEKFNARAMTAAHRTLRFGTRVRVTDVVTGRSVEVRINDRGPFIRGRIIDVSTAAAESLGIVGRGVAKVRVDVVD